MIDLNEVHPTLNHLVDGQLGDGRYVEFKIAFPRNPGDLMRLVVAIANCGGGLVIFGVKENPLEIIGIQGDYVAFIKRLEEVIGKLIYGLKYRIVHEVIEGKNVIILEISRSYTSAYFRRADTSPYRQIAYRFVEDENGKISLSAEEDMRYTKVYKYMTIDGFLSSLYCKSWRFFEPSKWNDKYEQRFYCATYKLPAAKGNTPQLFATCVTRVKNSEAAWKVYSHGQGLSAHCLQLELDILELRKQLRACGFHFEEKRITYEPENKILNLHKKRGSYYKNYFKSFNLDTFLNLLSIKRDAYTYEQEIRLFVIPNKGGIRNKTKKADYRDIHIDWSLVITKARVDKHCSAAELASIQRACFSVGINPIIKNYSFIGGLAAPAGCKDVDFELFDIDDMPGMSGIVIS